MEGLKRVDTSDADYYALGIEPPNPWYRRIGTFKVATIGGAALVICGSGALWLGGQWAGAGDETNASAPSGSVGAARAPRLRITNGCAKDPLWLANFAFQAPYFTQDLKLPAGETHEFDIPDEGLAATRFWAKWGCDKTGSSCTIGQSGGPGESCPEDGCGPPVDSKFEATFGCLPGTKSCAINPSSPKAEPIGPTDWWDVSQVDGWTLPYKVKVLGDCSASAMVIDCSGLSLDSCPEQEDLGARVRPKSSPACRSHLHTRPSM